MPWWEELRTKHAQEVEKEYKERTGASGVPNRFPQQRRPNTLKNVRMIRKW
jgi:hypothetical protein